MNTSNLRQTEELRRLARALQLFDDWCYLDKDKIDVTLAPTVMHKTNSILEEIYY